MFVEEPSRPHGPAEFSRENGTNERHFGFIADCTGLPLFDSGPVRIAFDCLEIAPGHPGGLLELPSDKDRKTSSRKSPAKVQSKDRDMGAALRSAYQRTVDESVPDEMLDLLNKLA